MSFALIKMWFALGSMGLMFLAVVTIYFSRFKLKSRFLKITASTVAYSLMLISGIIVFLVVFSGRSMNKEKGRM
ncbi:DUF2768 domain-containing protein [Bacillus pumilus]